MIACFDVHYRGESAAAAAALVFNAWSDAEPVAEYTVQLDEVGDYEPGKFYQRELEPLLAVIGKIQEPVDVFVIDAYCHLDAAGAPGLGAYLFEQLKAERETPPAVIGVAKSRFRGSGHAAEVLRGDSARPLLVTAIGLPKDEAAAHIALMDGEFRIPTLIKQVDQLCRQALDET